MDTHDGANVASQIPSTRGKGQVLGRVQSIGVDHKVAVVFVNGRGFASIARVEELWQGLAFDSVDFVELKPGRVRRDHDGVGLGCQVLLGFGLLLLNPFLPQSNVTLSVGVRGALFAFIRVVCWQET